MRNPNPRAFNLDASLLQCDLLLSFSLVKSLVALGGKKGVDWLVWRRQVCLGRRDTLSFYSPAHTGHVRYTRSGPIYSKMCFLSSNPLFYYFLVQKVYNLDPNRVSSLSLSNAVKWFSLFQIFGIYKISLTWERERDKVDCGLKKAISCVISQSNNQGEL